VQILHLLGGGLQFDLDECLQTKFFEEKFHSDNEAKGVCILPDFGIFGLRCSGPGSRLFSQVVEKPTTAAGRNVDEVAVDEKYCLDAAPLAVRQVISAWADEHGILSCRIL